MLLISSTTNALTSGTFLPFLLPFLSFASSLVNQSNARSNLVPVTRTSARKFSQLYTIKSMITSETTKSETRASGLIMKSTCATTFTSSITTTSITTTNSNASIKLHDSSSYRSKLNAFLVASFILIAGDIKGTDATLNFLSQGFSRLLGGGGGGGGGGGVSGRLTAGPISPIGSTSSGGRFGVSAGSFGGGGGGQSANLIGGLPGLPPGMTMTQDGCLCPVPKAKTKYIAVEVPKIVFVPPKESSKTKIITIKEVVSEPAAEKYSAMSNGYDDGDDSSYTSDSEVGVTQSSYTAKEASKNRASRTKSKTDASRNRVKVTRPDDDSNYLDNNEDDQEQEYSVKERKKARTSIAGHVSSVTVAPVIKGSAASSTSSAESNESSLMKDSASSISGKEIDSVIKDSSSAEESASGAISSGEDDDTLVISENEYKTSSSSLRRRRKKKTKDKSQHSKPARHRLTKEQLDDINGAIDDEQGHEIDGFTTESHSNKNSRHQKVKKVNSPTSGSGRESSKTSKTFQTARRNGRHHHHHQQQQEHLKHMSHYAKEENFDRSAHKEVDLEDEDDEDADDATSRIQVKSSTKGAFTL